MPETVVDELDKLLFYYHISRSSITKLSIKELNQVPIYEFICNDCGTEFEKLVSFSSTDVPTCINCHSKNVKRQMGLPAVHFKGSGWYINDSKKSTTSQKNGNGSAPESTEKSASDSSTDSSTKSESVSESKNSGTESTSSTKTSVSE